MSFFLPPFRPSRSATAHEKSTHPTPPTSRFNLPPELVSRSRPKPAVSLVRLEKASPYPYAEISMPSLEEVRSACDEPVAEEVNRRSETIGMDLNTRLSDPPHVSLLRSQATIEVASAPAVSDLRRCIDFLEATTHTQWKAKTKRRVDAFHGWIERSQTAVPELLSLTIHPAPSIPVLIHVMDPCGCRLVLSMDQVQRTKRILLETQSLHMCLLVTSKDDPTHPVHLISRSAPASVARITSTESEGSGGQVGR